MRFSLPHHYQKVVLEARVGILEGNGTKGYIVAQKDHALSLVVVKKSFSILKHFAFGNQQKDLTLERMQGINSPAFSSYGGKNQDLERLRELVFLDPEDRLSLCQYGDYCL